MKDRLELDTKLREILGSKNVYFQPPSNLRMQYDCIRYERSHIDLRHADNRSYKMDDRYTVTLIYRDPDSEIPHKILESFETISHDSHFISENLYHDVFTLYY